MTYCADPKGTDHMPITQRQLEEILVLAQRTPTGDNCQPWQFSFDGKLLSVQHREDRGRHALNKRLIASHFSLGMLFESLELAAQTVGLKAHGKIGKLEVSDGIWATFSFSAIETKVDPLSAQLGFRFTDRRTFLGGGTDALKPHPLSPQPKGEVGCKYYYSGVNVGVARFIAPFESIVPKVDEYCRDLMKWVRFNPDFRTVDGMPWQSLGIDYVSSRIFKWLNRFGLLVPLMKLGMSAELKRTAKKNVLSSAGLGLITVPSTDPSQIIDAGRMALRHWLKLNQDGFSLQPLSALSFFTLFEAEGWLAVDELAKYRSQIQKGLPWFRTTFGISDHELPLWLFRAGKGRPRSTELTPRLPLRDCLVINDSAARAA